ncbi:MAG TPA: hypothetical protein VLF71_04855 [Candidatus Saccharimonadales bacterium]|nr:hypothetical protein [Candidatus Saccharimonadales bacterium]
MAAEQHIRHYTGDLEVCIDLGSRFPGIGIGDRKTRIRRLSAGLLFLKRGGDALVCLADLVVGLPKLGDGHPDPVIAALVYTAATVKDPRTGMLPEVVRFSVAGRRQPRVVDHLRAVGVDFTPPIRRATSDEPTVFAASPLDGGRQSAWAEGLPAIGAEKAVHDLAEQFDPQLVAAARVQPTVITL